MKGKKCHFFRKEVPYLSHIESAEGLKPDPNKTEKVKNFPTPKSVTGIKSFLGLASYYRRFIQNFAKLANPLNNLTK